MKNLFCIILLVAVLRIGTAIGAPEIIGASSFQSGNLPVPAMRFVAYNLNDFRMLFCTEDMLCDRITRSVCVVDDTSQFKEMPVIKGDTIRSLFSRRNFKLQKEWQMRLIKKNAILQSSVNENLNDGKKVKDQNDIFLDNYLSPGDILVFVRMLENDGGKQAIDMIKRLNPQRK